MHGREAFEEIIKYVTSLGQSVDETDVGEFCKFILDTRNRSGRLFLCAEGRSMSILSLFGKRLAQDPLNIQVMPLALSSKPQIKDVDSVLICTGTGETQNVCFLAQNWVKMNNHVGLVTSAAAKEENARILGIVSSTERRPEAIVFIPGTETDDVKRRREFPNEIYPSLRYYLRERRNTVSASKFELGVLLFSEIVVLGLMRHIDGQR